MGRLRGCRPRLIGRLAFGIQFRKVGINHRLVVQVVGNDGIDFLQRHAGIVHGYLFGAPPFLEPLNDVFNADAVPGQGTTPSAISR